MKILLIAVAVTAMLTASNSAPTDFTGTTNAAAVICQLNQGNIPLCPATSCKELAETRLDTTDYRTGYYWLTNGASVTKAYCAETIAPSESQGWMRVGEVNSDATGCPQGLEEYISGERILCRKTVDVGCSSVIFPTHGICYSKVCGRVYRYIKTLSMRSVELQTLSAGRTALLTNHTWTV